MKVVLSPEAVQRPEAQIVYLESVEATAAAERLRARVMAFLSDHLANFPRTGHRLDRRGLWEIWVPGTRLVFGIE